jgi:glycosyltransferase involved in cell wall biosynthesis
VRQLTILSVAYSLTTVEPGSVGGAEQVLGELDRAIVARGHRSIVVACEGSQVAGELCATPATRGPVTPESYAAAHSAHRQAIAEALARWPVDVVHMHGMDFHRYLPPPGVPTLVTLHLPPSWYAPEVFALERPDTHLHCVSASQRRDCPAGARLLSTIENGVSVDHRAERVPMRDDVVALGRICPEKGFHLALDAARLARVPMRLAGRVFEYPEHRRYYHEEIRPRLDRARRFVGPVRGAVKWWLLSGARCVLVPSLVPETSCLVAMEALASGTPVVAFPCGALAEIVEPGVTGFLVRDVAEMAEAIAAARELDRDTCRRVARARYTAARMTSRYLARYQALAGMSAARRLEARDVAA